MKNGSLMSWSGCLAAAALLTACGQAPNESPAQVTAAAPVGRTANGDVRIDDTHVFPESVTSTADGTLITGSMKGVLFRAGPDEDVARAWARPRVAEGQQPAIFGVLAHDASETLWVCTGASFGSDSEPAPTALISLDLNTGQQRNAYVFPEPGGVCNDIAVAADGTVYATDTRNGRLLRLPKDGAELQVVGSDEKLAGIDGLAFAADGVLYVNSVTRHTLVRVEFQPDGSLGTLTELNVSQPMEGPDGLRPIEGNRFLQAEGISGRITEILIEGDNAQIRTLREGLNSAPAVTLVGNTAYAIEGKIGYLIDPALRDQDPGEFKILAIPLQ